jgi:hypothetical protein
MRQTPRMRYSFLDNLNKGRWVQIMSKCGKYYQEILTITQPSSVIFLYCVIYTYLQPDMFRPHTRPSSEAYV